MYNVVLIMTDQHRFDALGCMGNKVIETPHLDDLAAHGTRFECAYSPSPSCVPARACLLTGMRPWNAGVLGMGWGQGPMRNDYKHTLPGELSAAGYHTQGIGKMHFHPQRALNGYHNTVLDESSRQGTPDFVSDYRRWFLKHAPDGADINSHGIDWNSCLARPYHLDETLHATTWTVNESIAFLERRDPTKPFFLKTSFARPHSPYDPPRYYYDMYNQREDIPAPYHGEWDTIQDVPPEDASSCALWHGIRRPEEIRRARASYYGSITFIDHQIGRLLFYLRRHQLYNDTLIIFTSDHGDMLGDHNLWRKTYAYEGSAHIPLLIKYPDSFGKPVPVSPSPVTLEDIMPTVLSVNGLPIPETVDGIDLSGLSYRGETGRAYGHGEHSGCYDHAYEVQYLYDAKMKYIWYSQTGIEQLFDLEADRGESHDLSQNPEYAEVLALWRSRLVNELKNRNLGLTDGDRLVPLHFSRPIVSPYQ